MTPNEAARGANHDEVQQTLGANHRSNKLQPKLQEGDVVKVSIKEEMREGLPAWLERQALHHHERRPEERRQIPWRKSTLSRYRTMCP